MYRLINGWGDTGDVKDYLQLSVRSPRAPGLIGHQSERWNVLGYRPECCLSFVIDFGGSMVYQVPSDVATVDELL